MPLSPLSPEALQTPVRSASPATSTPPTVASSIGPSVSQRGSRPARPSLDPRWTSSSASSRSRLSYSTPSARDRSYSIESTATTRPALRKKPSGHLLASSASLAERGRGPSPLTSVNRPDEVDLLHLRPEVDDDDVGVDGLFVRFAVREIRHVEERARHSADAKKEELRLMVGYAGPTLTSAGDSVQIRVHSERYRDLLSAADSIVRMRTSASSLLDRLDVAQHDCTQEELTERARIGRRATKPSAGSSGTSYTTATLIKLLLDSPEHVWRAIERSDFLTAARLEGIARAVYRALAGAVDRRDEDVGDADTELAASFPLIEQQWETILHLGPQIVQRAKASLHHYDVTSQEVVETLAAAVMVENTPIVPDAVDLFLEMRRRALQAIFDPRRVTSPSMAGRKPAPAAPAASQGIEQTLQRAVHLVLNTVQHVKDAFFADRAGGPMLLNLLEQLQDAPEAPERPQTLTSPLNLPAAIPASVLASLPNAHALLRYLPASILTFTPFIDTTVPSEAPTPADRLSHWMTATLDVLTGNLDHLLTSAPTSDHMVQIRDGLADVWRAQSSSEQSIALHRVFDAALETRFTQTYREQLSQLMQSLPVQLHGALDKLASSPEDLDFPTFVYSSSVPFPALSAASAFVGHQSNPFQSFEDAISRRLEGRTPLVDAILRDLEARTESLRSDMSHWLRGQSDPSSLKSYRQAVHETFEQVVEILQRLLADCSRAVAPGLFIGSVAECLATSSDFARRLILEGVDDTSAVPIVASFETALKRIALQSLSSWHEVASTHAIEIVQSSLERLASGTLDFDASSFEVAAIASNGHIDGAPLRVPTQPSMAISSALQSLIVALGSRRAGSAAAQHLLHDVTDRLLPIVVNFTTTAAAILQGALALQILFDVQYLQEICKFDGLVWNAVVQDLQFKIGPVAPLATEVVIKNAQAALQRQQALLAPLLTLSPTFRPAAASTVHTEFKSPLGVAAPGPRLGMLPVSALTASN